MTRGDTSSCLLSNENALLILENPTANWKGEREKQDHIVFTELFTNAITWGQSHTLGEL